MSTIALDLPTWIGPAWATEHTETDGGLRWERQATTAVASEPERLGTPGDPVPVTAAAYDFLEVVSPAVLVERQPVQVSVGALVLDLDGARNLIAALTELVEGVEEGTR